MNLRVLSPVALLALACHAPGLWAAEGDDSWLRTSIPGFTVYSDLPEAEARRRLAALLVAIDDFSRVWPTPQQDSAAPGLIVFCGQPRRYADVSPNFVHLPLYRRDPAEVFLNTRYTPQDGRLPLHGGYEFRYDPLLDNWNDHLLQAAYSAYFQRLVGERVPPWIRQGLGRLMEGMCCREDVIEFPAFTPDSTLGVRRRTQGSEASLQAALDRKRFTALDRLLGEPKPPPPVQLLYSAGHDGRYHLGPDNRSFWNTLPEGPFINEAYELAYFGLFADGGRHRAGFIRFAQAASNGPLDEAAIRNCLGMDESELLRGLWRCTAYASDQAYPLPPRTGSPAPTAASLKFRAATPPETAQMMQAWSAAKEIGMGTGNRTGTGIGEDLYQTIYDPLLAPISESEESRLRPIIKSKKDDS